LPDCWRFYRASRPAGNRDFNMFLWMPPTGDRAGDSVRRVADLHDALRRRRESRSVLEEHRDPVSAGLWNAARVGVRAGWTRTPRRIGSPMSRNGEQISAWATSTSTTRWVSGMSRVRRRMPSCQGRWLWRSRGSPSFGQVPLRTRSRSATARGRSKHRLGPYILAPPTGLQKALIIIARAPTW